MIENKYFILIREWFKESQIEIPEHLDETIYFLKDPNILQLDQNKLNQHLHMYLDISK